MATAKGNDYNLKRLVNPQHTPDSIHALSEEIKEWAANSRKAHFASWAWEKKRGKSWINELARDYPEFAKAYEDAKDIMAAKLVNSSIYHDDVNFKGEYAMQYMPVYNSEFREYLKWKSQNDKPESTEFQKAVDDFIAGVKQITQQSRSTSNS